ncbi:MAG: DUF3015 family protein [Nitrospiraceae bacterium]
MRQVFGLLVLTCVIALLQTTGCTLKGTTNEITDTTSNITGTTSGHAWWNEDGQLKPDFKTTAFVTINHRNLQQDIAAGGGEYLASMGALLGIPGERQSTFFSAAQVRYAQVSGLDASAPAALLALLQEAATPFVQ